MSRGYQGLGAGKAEWPESFGVLALFPCFFSAFKVVPVGFSVGFGSGDCMMMMLISSQQKIVDQKLKIAIGFDAASCRC